MPCDASDMFAVHSAMRRGLQDSARLLRRERWQDEHVADAIVEYLRTISELLHAHHGSEDILVFPVLAERCDADRAIVERVGGQHAMLDRVLDQLDAAVPVFAAQASSRSATALLLTVVELEAGLREHLEDEERHIVPLIERHLDDEEWRAMPGASMSKMEPERALLSLGLVLDELDADGRAALIAALPDPVRAAWLNHGASAHTALMGVLHSAA